jgi:general secretion pathway protein J
MHNRIRQNGFTLVELLVASLIGAFIAVTAAAALRGVTIGREKLTAINMATGEVRFGVNMIRTDLENIYRDRNARYTKLVGMVDEGQERASSRIVFYAVNSAKARPQLAEGDVYEIEYFVMTNEQRSVLCRRLWPNPNENTVPGGIVTTVAEDIAGFEIRYFDGQNWQREWPQGQNLPEMIEVRLAIQGGKNREPVMRSILVNVRLLQERPESMGLLEQADDTETSDSSI